MADYPPYMNAYGLLPKILEKIKEAQTPERFTQDFLAKTLGFSGGSARPFIPLAKRLGLLGTDGSPTELYKSFRNPSRTKGAMAQALRRGYADLFSRNENLHKVGKEELEGLVIQATGLDKGAPTARSICATFEAMKGFADFANGKPPSEGELGEKYPPDDDVHEEGKHKVRFGIGYTINLNLPKTDDVAVFNAIFKSLRDNLLQ
jgi:hypothetical protein